MIICCGEALIDMIERDTVDGLKGFVPHAGGAVFNTAIGLGRLGVPVGFFTGLSTDMFGPILEQTLAESHVDASFCARSARPTTLAFVKLVNGNASYSFVDEGTAGRMLSVDDMPQFGDDVEALHFGAISLIFEPCGSTYEALFMREAGRRVLSLDPNIRPGFIRDADAHRARMNRMIPKADIVKVSDEDLDWLAMGDDPATLPKRWSEAGVSVVIITRGADGAEALTRNGHVSVPGRKVEVVDTIGAGDTFNSGVMEMLRARGLLNRESLRSISDQDMRAALARGAEVAAVTVSRAGANPPRADELGALDLG